MGKVLETIAGVDIEFSEQNKEFVAILPSGELIKRKTFISLKNKILREMCVKDKESDGLLGVRVITNNNSYRVGICTGRKMSKHFSLIGRVMTYEIEFDDGAKKFLKREQFRKYSESKYSKIKNNMDEIHSLNLQMRKLYGEIDESWRSLSMI